MAVVAEIEVAAEPMAELQQLLEQPMTGVVRVDEGSGDALPGPVDKGCGSQRLEDVQVHVDIHEVGQHDSSADTVACGGRKDTVGILVDMVACDRRREL